MTTTHLKHAASCAECGFTTTDIALLEHHSCDIQANGGHCEDFPCCGHEYGDCNGLKYGSDEAIKAQLWGAHRDCDHEAGLYHCDDEDFDDED